MRPFRKPNEVDICLSSVMPMPAWTALHNSLLYPQNRGWRRLLAVRGLPEEWHRARTEGPAVGYKALLEYQRRLALLGLTRKNPREMPGSHWYLEAVRRERIRERSKVRESGSRAV